MPYPIRLGNKLNVHPAYNMTDAHGYIPTGCHCSRKLFLIYYIILSYIYIYMEEFVTFDYADENSKIRKQKNGR